MKKRKINSFIYLSIGLMLLLNVYMTFKKELNIDLSKQKQIAGKISYSDVRDISNGGGRFKTFKRVFYFRLNNSKQKFAVYRSDDGYEDLKSEIDIDSFIKVTYLPGYATYNTDVFQIEKQGKILQSYESYYKQKTLLTSIACLSGICFIVGAIMQFFNVSLVKALSYFVEH